MSNTEAKQFIVIGAGVAGLSAAINLAHNAPTAQVKILEKLPEIGGRLRQRAVDGFKFDLGPSWYWMPDIIEQIFANFSAKPADYFELIRLDPAFRIIFGNDSHLDLPGKGADLPGFFESVEPGAGEKFVQFNTDAKQKYQLGMGHVVYKPCLSWSEAFDWRIIKNLTKTSYLRTLKSLVRQHFKDPRLQKIMEFPVLFLGTLPADTPGFYSLMNYGGYDLGTWYPKGGMVKLAEALGKVALERGVEICCNQAVTRITPVAQQKIEVKTINDSHLASGVVAAADYAFVDQHLLEKKYQQYSDQYWQSRKLAPSAIILHLGVSTKIKRLLHHNIFFDTDFDQHASALAAGSEFPEDPLFYACCPSKTDPDVAPDNSENLFILIPVPAGVSYDAAKFSRVRGNVIGRIEHFTQQKFSDQIVVEETFEQKDFVETYNSLRGNAYGLANTLLQTAFGKPRMKHSKIDDLYFAGQMTVPGPGLPPSMISGQLAAEQLLRRS